MKRIEEFRGRSPGEQKRVDIYGHFEQRNGNFHFVADRTVYNFDPDTETREAFSIGNTSERSRYQKRLPPEQPRAKEPNDEWKEWELRWPFVLLIVAVVVGLIVWSAPK